MSNYESEQPKVTNLADLREKGIISPELASEIGQQATFAVSFESTQLPGLSDIVKRHIHQIDDLSRQEAEKRGGLVYYHAGDVNPITLEAFSTCFWKSRALAVKALHGPSVHSCEAIPLAKSGLVYAKYAIKFYSIYPDENTGFTYVPLEIKTGHDFSPAQQESSHANI